MSEKKRRGRPPASPDGPKDTFVSMRMTEKLHSAVAEMAEKNGRSIGAEIEQRIIASLANDQIGDVARFVDQAIKTVESAAGYKWLDDPDVKERCWSAAIYALDLMLGDENIRRRLLADALNNHDIHRLEGEETLSPEDEARLKKARNMAEGRRIVATRQTSDL